MKIDFLSDHMKFVPELAELHFNEWHHLSPDSTLEERAAKLREMAQSDEMPSMVVAVESGTLVGSAALVYEDMKTRKDLSPWLASVFVKPQFRKSGIATRLVNHIEAEAKRHGIDKLFLYTEHARDLYLKLGWHDLDACEYQGVNVSIMYKQFTT